MFLLLFRRTYVLYLSWVLTDCWSAVCIPVRLLLVIGFGLRRAGTELLLYRYYLLGWKRNAYEVSLSRGARGGQAKFDLHAFLDGVFCFPPPKAAVLPLLLLALPPLLLLPLPPLLLHRTSIRFLFLSSQEEYEVQSAVFVYARSIPAPVFARA